MSRGKNITGHELYHFSGCPYCLWVRLNLWWLGLKLPLHDAASDTEAHAALLAGGGKDQVPCLRIETADGKIEWLYESSDIIRYLKTRFT